MSEPDTDAMWDPHVYRTIIRTEIPAYDELQQQVVEATVGMSPRLILDLGVGAGETAGRILRMHSQARLVGIDSSAEMLVGAAEVLPPDRVTLIQEDLKAPLPEQSFDLVISALAIHHLQGEGKARLFRKIRERLAPGGTFVLGDVVIPDDPADAVINNEPGYDFPSTIEDQLRWMKDAGFLSETVWVQKDLAVIKSEQAAT